MRACRRGKLSVTLISLPRRPDQSTQGTPSAVITREVGDGSVVGVAETLGVVLRAGRGVMAGAIEGDGAAVGIASADGSRTDATNSRTAS